MQIHELNEFNGTLSSAYTVLDDGSDTGKKSIGAILSDVNNDMDDLEARFNNAISAVTVNTEVQDIRVGADGTTYATAGDAVRGQVDELSAAMATDYSAASTYEVGDYCWYSGALYRCTTAITTAEAWTAGHWIQAVLASDLKDDLGYGKNVTLAGYWDESWTSGIGGNIYKSDTIVVPAGATIKTISYYSNVPSSNGYIYILDSNNKILYKYNGTSGSSIGWESVTINKTFNVDVYVAVSGFSTAFTYSIGVQSDYYSMGLWEGSALQNTSVVGDTLSFTQNVATRYYSFGVKVVYHTEGLKELVDALESSVSLTDFTMPKVYKTSEEGYTLLGRWCSFSSYDSCCNSAGAQIMFKIKGATSLNVDLRQIVHPNHSDWTMAVEPYFAISIDGGSFTRHQIGSSAVTISIADTDEHFVWIVVDGMCLYSGPANRNSGWSGVYINDVSTDGTMYKVIPASKQFLFVGDSIVEGINTLGTTSTSEANSAVNEFSFLTARKLDAIPILQGYGGTSSLNGQRYERYSWVDGLTDSFTVNNEVDAILVEYGYNDASAGYTSAQFKSYYNELLDLLVGHYTGVPVFCLIPFAQSFADEIREMAEARSYCYCIETADYNVTYSDSSHPNAAGAESIATSLSADILKILPKSFFL